MSLGYDGVTYVTKVVFKSAKLIPTMVVGNILDRLAKRVGKKYTAYEYASAVLLCIGAIGFCISPSDLKGDDNSQENTGDATEGNVGAHWIGISLLATSVVCDALVPNIQQQLMKGTTVRRVRPQSLPSNKDSDVDDSDGEIEKEMKNLIDKDDTANYRQKETKSEGISSQALLVNTNSIGFTLLVLSTILVNRSFLSIISQLVTHPHFLILHVSVGMGLGTALAYTELIRRSGPAVAVAVATLRKVVTILLSYIIFPKPMTGVHAISAGLVVSGLGLSYYGRGKK